jgi:hypothetical protein
MKVEDHCVMLPRLGLRDFLATLDLSDIALDSIGWSGGNTALKCLSATSRSSP